MELSDKLELSDYETPEFYDRYARALDRCVNSSVDLAIKTGVFVGNVLSTVMSLTLGLMENVICRLLSTSPRSM